VQTILCYRRKSLVRQESDLISPARQKQAVEAAVMLLGPGYRAEWYEDMEGHRSGRSEGGRPGWLTLKARIGSPNVAGVACYSLSRIYRNVREFLQFVDELNRLGLRLIVVKENIDTGSAVGMAINTILMALYQLESDLASERMTETIEYKRRSLRQHWGTVPFGCVRNAEQKLEPDPETAHRLQRLYELFATGLHTYDSLCAQMNAEDLDYRGRDGEDRAWSRDDVRRTLTLWRIYAGSVTLGRSRDDPEVLAIRDAHEPILPRALCLQVAAQLDLRRTRHVKRSHCLHMLSGLVYCGYCARELSSTTRNGVRRYRHRGSKGDCPEIWVEAAALEDAIIGHVAGLWTAEARARIDARIDAILDEAPDAQSARREIAAAEEQINRLIDLYLAGHIDRTAYLTRSQTIEHEIESLHSRRQGPAVAAIDAASARLATLCGELPHLEMAAQREQLLAAFERITVRNGAPETFTPAAWLAPIWEDVGPQRPKAPEPERKVQARQHAR
jgi:DNA invertase Pin-like site-specific DNA recombinase